MAPEKLTAYLSAFHSRRLAPVCPVGIGEKAPIEGAVFWGKSFGLLGITGGYGSYETDQGSNRQSSQSL